TSPSTPPPLAPPTPAKPPADKDAGQAPGAPSAILEPPARVKPDAAPAPALNKIADGDATEPGGFPKAPTAPRVEIPYGPAHPAIPPPPPFAPAAPPAEPPPAAPPPPADHAVRDGPPPRTA